MTQPPTPDVARQDLCRFLAACYYEPSADFTEAGLFTSLHAVAAALDPELATAAARLGPAFAAEPLEALAVDHARLFIGPGRPLAVPYASFWLSPDQSLMHEATAAVLEMYAAGEFELAEDFRDLPDHIAVELEFLYLLRFRANQAKHAGDWGAAADIERLREHFVGTHLDRWVGPFAAAVREHAETPFYRELGILTERTAAAW